MNHETLRIEYASPGADLPEDAGWPTAMLLWSSPGYLEAAGVRLRAGRDFRPGEGVEEGEEMPRPVIVSARVARAVWPEDDAVGRTLRLRSRSEPFHGRVIGVIDDHYHDGIDETRDALIYLPMERRALRRRFLVVRAEGEPAGLVPALRETFGALDPDLPVDDRPMSAVVFESSFPWTVGSAVLMGRVAEAFLFGVSPNDPVALFGSVLVFLAVAALAAFLPARRAAKVAPALALRSE